MNIFEIVTPTEAEIARMLTTVTMVVLIGVGWIPVLRSHAHHIRFAVAGWYIVSVVGFSVYLLFFR